MAYINNEIITVDAVLTKKGRELLAANGGLNIKSYALSDDEIDYRLYQPNHPQGSAYYDLAIRNTPVFEAFTDETQLLKYKLVTLPSGVTSIPVISLGQSAIYVDKDYKGEVVIVPSTNPVYNTTLGYTAILSNKSAGTIIGEQLQNVTTTANLCIIDQYGAMLFYKTLYPDLSGRVDIFLTETANYRPGVYIMFLYNARGDYRYKKFVKY